MLSIGFLWAVMMKNAIVVEDVPAMGVWFQSMLLEAYPGVDICLCKCVEEAAQEIRENKYSLALLDINLPDGDGISLVREIKKKSESTYVVMVTIFDDEFHLFRSLKEGADGYLLKDLPDSLFVSKLAGIIDGDPPLSPGVARKVLNFFSRQADTGMVRRDIHLSPREQEVLRLVAKGYSRKEIAKLFALSPNTIAGYVRDVYKKLNISSQAEAAMEACRLGLVDFNAK